MHRAVILDGTPTAKPRSFFMPLAWLLPWHWSRMFEHHARREAKAQGCAFIHFGVDCVLHLPEGSYTVPWRDVRAHRDALTWRIEAAGVVLDLVDEHLSPWERRRLQSSSRWTSP